MNYLLITKRTVVTLAIALACFGGTSITSHADEYWDTGSVGTYTGGWDTGSVGTYTGGWDTGSVGTYTGGWDTGSVGTYTGGWDTGSVGTVTAVPTYSDNWDTTVTTTGYTYSPGYTYTPGYTISTGGSVISTGNVISTGGTITTGGSVISTGNIISTGNVIGTTNNTVCSDGYAPVNGTCVRTTTIPTVNNTVCSDGYAPTNGSCVRTRTIPTTTNTVCSDGYAPTNGTCIRTTTVPTTNTVICSDGSAPINGSCVRVTTIPTVYYQSCWDGSRIPTTSVCPAQYKTCPNGTSVPVTQVCPIVTTPIYVPPQVVKFNNVVTSVATEISKTSGRCNGIGLIAGGAQSTGWFEYGETSALGRTTATANIGSENTAPFSNVLTNLKPSTRYYCRAVMQNQYGLVKGEIVSFTTKATTVTYVKPVVTKPVVKTPVKPTTTITCSDGSTVSTKSTSSATLLNQGEKLIAAQVEKIDGNLASGEVIRYKVTYKNLSDTRLSGILVKVTLPQEVAFAGATAGNYDISTRTLTLNQDTIDPYTEGVIMITANVQKDAPIGKTIVTNVYVMYTVPGTNTHDEVTAYVVGSIMPTTTIANQDTGAKKVIGTGERSFMPSSLIEWLAFIAILFIIFILGRSVYASYKEEDTHKH